MSLIRIGPASLGERVVVRRLLDDGRASDVVGLLTRLDAAGVSVQPDDGPSVDVPADLLVAAKPVPARRVLPSSSPERLERAMTQSWPGLEVQRLGGWILRAAGGFTRRGNSALATGDPGVALDQALDAVTGFYRARDLPPSVQIPVPLPASGAAPPLLLTALAERGWRQDAPTSVMTADLRRPAPTLSRPGQLPEGYTIDLAAEPDDAWLAACRYRGAALPPVARAVLTAAPVQDFVSVRHGGRTAAVGRVGVAAGWAGVSAMQVADDQRRKGLARAVLQVLCESAVRHGARYAYLQVDADNEPARALYHSAGFTDHHHYSYWTPAP